MEVRGQVENNDVRMSSGGGGRRGDGNHNGNSTFLSYGQTLDQHHHRGNNSGGGGGGGSNSTTKGNSAAAVVRYRECLRNHAASVGGNVYDGCGEFMPGGEEGSLEALKCAACDCHRNFHRKEIDGETAAASPTATVFSPGSRRGGGHLVHALQLPPALPSPVMHHHHPHHNIHGSHHRYLHSASPPAAVHPINVAFGGGGGGGSAATGGTESSSEDLNAFPSEVAMGMHSGGMGAVTTTTPPQPPYGMPKKRFRTKFTPEQKEKMMDFAEKVGWKMNKQDEEAVERFCSEVGVERKVFKVWMHNNKNVKKQLTPTAATTPTTVNMMNMHHHHHHHGQPADDEEVRQHHQEGML